MTLFFQTMMWPLVACLILPGILVYLGLHIIRREIIFVDLALAQVAALGACVAILTGHHAGSPESYAWSVGFTIIGAGIFTLTRTEKARVPHEALIGIVYVVAAAAGILLLSRSPEGDEELRRTLVGDVLLVRPFEIARTFSLYAVIAIVHLIFRKQFLTISFEPEKAVGQGLRIRWWDFLFYSLFGIVVTSFVQIGGVLLVFSYLIVPAVFANFIVKSFFLRLISGWILATLASVIALYLSFQFDFPTGAAIVCVLGSTLLLIPPFLLLANRKSTQPKNST
jgi:zinc/manganese transport system permease protein